MCEGLERRSSPRASSFFIDSPTSLCVNDGDDLNLILILKELWRRRLLVGLSVVAAAALTILAVFQVSVSPPSIAKKSQVEAQGSIEILVDSARSPIADARRDLTGLTARAGVFASYIAGGNVIGQIAKANGIPVGQIAVTGPVPLPGEAPGADEEAAQQKPYAISITQSGELPILAVVTRAPTVPEARKLAAAAPPAISRVVEKIQTQQGTPTTRRVEFRVLGPAEAALVDESLGNKVAAMLFLVLLSLFVVAILAAPRLVVAWRAAEPDAQSEDRYDEAEATSEVLRLAASRGESGAEDRGADLIQKRGEPS